MSRRFLTADDVRRSGGGEIAVDPETVVTPQALEVARGLGVTIRAAGGEWREPLPDRGPDAAEEQAHPHFLPEPEDELMGTGVIVTVVGCNRPGVLAEVTAIISDRGASIRDISQKMVGDYFHMVLVVEVPEASQFNELKEALGALDAAQEYVVRVMHERVFRYMHRI